MRKTFFKLLPFCLFLIIVGCNKEEDVQIDPQEAILGKWEISYFGSSSIEEASGYEEYLTDSAHVSYFYDEEVPYTSTYWFSDSLLHISTDYGIVGEDTVVTITLDYKYEFLSRNKLKLDLQERAIETRFIYKRIE